MKAKIISFGNHKGGVAKTTTTANVASILASMGKKVLAVDLDAQANLTVCLLKDEPEESIYYALTGKSENLPIVPINSNLDLVPSSLQLAMAEMEMSTAISREKILLELLSPLKSKYDYIFIDCPPSLGLLTLNAFTASDEIIVPLIGEVLPFKGFTMINDFVNQVRSRLNSTTRISGVLLTRWEKSNLSKEIEKRLRQYLGDLVFSTKIRKNITLAEAPLVNKNIVDFAPKCNGTLDYQFFVNEFLSRYEEK